MYILLPLGDLLLYSSTYLLQSGLVEFSAGGIANILCYHIPYLLLSWFILLLGSSTPSSSCLRGVQGKCFVFSFCISKICVYSTLHWLIIKPVLEISVGNICM